MGQDARQLLGVLNWSISAQNRNVWSSVDGDDIDFWYEAKVDDFPGTTSFVFAIFFLFFSDGDFVLSLVCTNKLRK